MVRHIKQQLFTTYVPMAFEQNSEIIILVSSILERQDSVLATALP